MSMVGSWSATAASSVLIVADEYREELVIQHHSGDSVFLAFGDDAVEDEGIRLDGSVVPVVVVKGAKAREAVYGICATAKSATGGWQLV